MADLNREMIDYLSSLSRIRLCEEEGLVLLRDLNEILDYVKELQTVDTENTPICDNVLEDMGNVMRDDITGETMPRELFLSNAPSTIGGMIRVPPVIEGGDA